MTGFRLAIRTIVSAGAEPVIWAAALVWFALLGPGTSHFSLCPLANLGIAWCPGCGLGRAISYALHGEFTHSMHAHLAGVPTVIVLLFRIATLIREAYLREPTPVSSLSLQDNTHG